MFSRAEAWIDLMMDAAWEPHDIYYKGRLFHLKRGQLVTSYRDLGKRWRWSTSKVRRFLCDAQVNGEAAHQTTHNATLITVLGLRACHPPRISERHSERHSDDTVTTQRRHTIEEGKEGKEGKEDSQQGSGDGAARLYQVFQRCTSRLAKPPTAAERELCVELVAEMGDWKPLAAAVEACVRKAGRPVHSIRYCEGPMREAIHEARKQEEPSPIVGQLLERPAVPASHILYERKPTDGPNIEGMERGLESVGGIIARLGGPDDDRDSQVDNGPSGTGTPSGEVEAS